MRRLLVVMSMCMGVATLMAAQAAQQASPANPLVAGARMDYQMVKNNLTKAAEQIPEALYAFKATPDVRSVGQIFAHVADSNYAICAAAGGAKPPVGGIEKSTTAKAAVVKALGESFAYCDQAFGSMTDAEGARMGDFFGRPMAKLSILTFNTGHDHEHYGNLVTYMRLNKLVPPSSQR